jgi:hypothetical protein
LNFDWVRREKKKRRKKLSIAIEPALIPIHAPPHQLCLHSLIQTTWWLVALNLLKALHVLAIFFIFKFMKITELPLKPYINYKKHSDIKKKIP